MIIIRSDVGAQLYCRNANRGNQQQVVWHDLQCIRNHEAFISTHADVLPDLIPVACFISFHNLDEMHCTSAFGFISTAAQFYF